MEDQKLATQVRNLTQTSLVLFSNTQEHFLITTTTPRWIQIAIISDISFTLKDGFQKSCVYSQTLDTGFLSDEKRPSFETCR